MKRLFPIPKGLADQLKKAGETGIGYQVASVQLRDGRCFDQVVISGGHIIVVRGHRNIPFEPEDVETVTVNHKDWNFRCHSEALRRRKTGSSFDSSALAGQLKR